MSAEKGARIARFDDLFETGDFRSNATHSGLLAPFNATMADTQATPHATDFDPASERIREHENKYGT